MNKLQVDHIINCEGLACPMPIVKTKKAIDEVEAGMVIEVRSTDRGSVTDLPSWAAQTGHQYIGMQEVEGMWKHFIRKSEANKAKEAIKHPHVIGNDQLHSQLNSDLKIKLIDVREPAEYAFGHIPGAISMPLGQLAQHIKDLDPQGSYILICRSGNRSDTACMLLAEQGFNHVVNAYEGMMNWKHAQERSL